jgi:hypothetical protein
MKRINSLSLLAGWLLLIGVAPAHAQVLRYHWQQGQVLEYQVEQATKAVEVVGDNTSTSSTKVSEVKRWEVLAVDSAGVGTIRLSLVRLRLETDADGETLLFDSTAPDKSNPQLQEQLSKFVGVPLVALRVGPDGKVLEIKEGKYGTLNKYETEAPFVAVLPTIATAPRWERNYKITLEPPQGTGEKFEALQTYEEVPGGRNGPTQTYALKTTVKKLPEAVADQLPLLPLQPQGTVEFDTAAGLMRKANLAIDKEVKGHQGDGSSYHFTSSYVETLLPSTRK